MDEIKIKAAFDRVKQEMTELKDQLFMLQNEISELRSMISQFLPQARELDNQSFQHNPLQQQAEPLETPAHFLDQYSKHPLYIPKTSNTKVSSRNEGVPADRQTDQQTDRHIPVSFVTKESSDFQDFSDLLASLDIYKEDLKLRFTHITNQEFLVFSTIYQLDNEGFAVDYVILAKKLGLTESSIRDYIQKLIKKGIPIEKIKENNKKITLKIPQDFKKIASLQTLLSLRNL